MEIKNSYRMSKHGLLPLEIFQSTYRNTTIIDCFQLTLDTVRFIDFGSLPCFIALSELASTETRRQALRKGYTQYLKLYTKDLELPGPYLSARSTKEYNLNLNSGAWVVGPLDSISISYPVSESY